MSNILNPMAQNYVHRLKLAKSKKAYAVNFYSNIYLSIEPTTVNNKAKSN